MTYPTDDRARVRRQRADQAIQLAMESRWDEAAQVNRSILSLFPNDVDAYNRLGKALTELGRYSDARAAYGRTLELDGANSIAKKNLSRLQALGDTVAPAAESRQKADPDLFIEETGKTGTTELVNTNAAALKVMTAGDLVLLSEQEAGLQVTDPAGTVLGTIEPRLALRLLNFMKSGNQYAAAIATVNPDGGGTRVIIKETYQSGDNAGKLSFPPTATDGFRGYTKERLVRRELDDEDHDDDERDPADDWDSTEEPDEGAEINFESRRSRDSLDTDDEEFDN